MSGTSKFNAYQFVRVYVDCMCVCVRVCAAGCMYVNHIKLTCWFTFREPKFVCKLIPTDK